MIRVVFLLLLECLGCMYIFPFFPCHPSISCTTVYIISLPLHFMILYIVQYCTNVLYRTAGLFRKVDSSQVTTFYDSVCGLPVFNAPVGRSFDERVKVGRCDDD
jgi:hypothetical protein